MACSVYKVFTRERGTYQDINGIQEYFRDYINNNLQLIADCVSTNTVLKVVKRDASGNFAAGTITANLTGNVTGNVSGNITGDLTGNIIGGLTGNVTGNCSGSSGSCTGNAATATLADNATLAATATFANAASASTRFQVSGIVGGGFDTSQNPVFSSVPGNAGLVICRVRKILLAGEVLKLKYASCSFSSPFLRLKVSGLAGSWQQTTELLLLDTALDVSLLVGPASTNLVDVSGVNINPVATALYSTDSYRLEFAVENA